MKKFLIVLLLLIIVIGIILVGRFYKFRLNEETVTLNDIRITDTNVSFKAVNNNSGCFLKEYKFIKDDSILYIEFYGTMFPQMQIDDLNIVIEESEVSEVRVINDINKRDEK